jgi:hypothetical protein
MSRNHQKLGWKIKGLLGGGKTGALTLFIEDEDCRCKTNQTFRQVAEDRDLEIQSDSLISEEDGSWIDTEDKIGDHFEVGSTVTVFWDVPDEEEREIDQEDPYKDSIKLKFRVHGEWLEMIIGKDHTMRSFMLDNWEEIEWEEFIFQGKALDPDTPLLDLADDQLKISVEIRTKAELEMEKEHEIEEETPEDQDDLTLQEDDQGNFDTNIKSLTINEFSMQKAKSQASIVTSPAFWRTCQPKSQSMSASTAPRK